MKGLIPNALLIIVLAVNNKLTINYLLNKLVFQPLDYTTTLQQNAKVCMCTVKEYSYEYYFKISIFKYIFKFWEFFYSANLSVNNCFHSLLLFILFTCFSVTTQQKQTMVSCR